MRKRQEDDKQIQKNTFVLDYEPDRVSTGKRTLRNCKRKAFLETDSDAKIPVTDRKR